MKIPHVVIIGGGFGGLTVVQSLRRANVEMVLIDRTNHHLFQPLLYQVATAALSPADIASPLRSVLRSQRNVQVVMDEVLAIDKERRLVVLAEGEAIPFEYLIVAPGSRHWYFGRDGWEQFAPGLKTLSDALEIRERLILSFERAERVLHRPEARKYLTFVIVGGGPTGVELAGALAEIAREAVVRDFSALRAEDFTIMLLEGSGSILSAYPPLLRDKAKRFLEELGVVVRLNANVTEVTEKGVYAENTFIETVNVIWAAGNRASPLLESLRVPLDQQGRVIVRQDLTIPGDPSIFVIGDAACCDDGLGKALPPLAPVAMQQARYVASVIQHNMGEGTRQPFVYRDRGTMTTVGRAKAVAEIGRLHFAGLLAWLLWSLVHIFFLIGFRNRLRVMSEWVWYYFTYKPGAQLIYWKTRRREKDSRPR
ncbi:MAG: NAD(P)/FAD-dependent oxidoreductase [Nitrospiraceae bacterium]